MEYNGPGEWNRVDPDTQRTKIIRKYESDSAEESAGCKIDVLRKGPGNILGKGTMTLYFQEKGIFAKLMKELGRVLWPYSGDEVEGDWKMPRGKKRDKIYTAFVQKFDSAIKEIKKLQAAEKKLLSPLVAPRAPVTPTKKDDGTVPDSVTLPSLPSGPNAKTTRSGPLSRSDSEELFFKASISEAEEDVEDAAGDSEVEEIAATEAGQERVEDEITINDQVATGSKRKQGNGKKKDDKKQNVVYKRTKATEEDSEDSSDDSDEE